MGYLAITASKSMNFGSFLKLTSVVLSGLANNNNSYSCQIYSTTAVSTTSHIILANSDSNHKESFIWHDKEGIWVDRLYVVFTGSNFITLNFR